jgi:hypothetical protein
LLCGRARVVVERADVDNRLKTLFDASRRLRVSRGRCRPEYAARSSIALQRLWHSLRPLMAIA